MKTFYTVMLVVWGVALGLNIMAFIWSLSLLSLLFIGVAIFFIIRDYHKLMELS